MQQLAPNTLLQGGKYRIEKVLGQGGFGITYLAEQVMLGRKVAIKEFFMKELCERDETTSHVTLGTEGCRETVSRFREKFLKEARNIAKLNHPNIVRIIDVFEENGTAYYVMEYAENGSLADKVKKDGYLSEPVATRYILQVADALEYIHQRKMNHLDIKPGNIMLNEKDEAILIDFGLSKQYDATTGNQTSTTPVGISEGYAPMEQYKQGGVGEFSPETDIYALGATFFKLLTGVTPPSASDVNEDGVPVNDLKAKGVRQAAIDIICKAMEGRKKDRIHDVRIFVEALNVDNIFSNVSTEQNLDLDESTILDNFHQKKSEVHPLQNTVTIRQETKQDDRYKDQQAETAENDVPKKSKIKNMYFRVGFGIIIIAAITVGIMKIIDSQSVKSFTVNGVTFEMIEVQKGTFMMGATNEMKEPWDNEKPVHKVTLTNNYYIGKTEVTQSLWKAVMGNNPSYCKGDMKPVENVSWNDCKEFISKLNYITGQKFRLPTEAEWEFAARGGKKTKHYEYSGSNILDDVAWHNFNGGIITQTTHNVASKQPNELGVYDMNGNVWEWCSDWYGKYTRNAQVDPIGPQNGSIKVIRGNSWIDIYYCFRISFRQGKNPSCRHHSIGFRLVLSE